MILRSIRVRNIRSHRETTIHLAPGVNLLTGDVGSGKTSLLQAVEFGLFGLSIDPTGRTNSDHLVRHGAGKAEVEVTFEDGTDRWTIVRRISRRTRGDREILSRDPGEVVHKGVRSRLTPTELKREAIRYLGFPDNPNPQAHSDVWRWAVYVPQEQMRVIIASDRPLADQRLETLRRALGIERCRTARENCEELAQELRRRADEEARRARDARAQCEDLPPLRAQAQSLAEDLRALREQRDVVRTRIGELEAVVEPLPTWRAEIRVLEERLRELQDQRTQWDSRIAQLQRDRNALQRELSEREEREETLRRAIEQIAGAPEDVASLETALDEVRRERSLVDQRVHERDMVKTRWQETRRREEELQRLCQEREADAERLKTQWEKLCEKFPPEEPTCSLPPLEELRDRIRGIQERIRRVREELAVERDRVRETEELLRSGRCPRCGQTVDADRFQVHLAEARERLARITAKDAELGKHQEELEGQRERREAFERDHLGWTQGRLRVDEAHQLWEERLRERDDLRRSLEEAREESFKLQREWESLPDLSERRRQLNAEEQRVHNELLQARDRRERRQKLEEQLQENRVHIQGLRDRLSLSDRHREEAQKEREEWDRRQGELLRERARREREVESLAQPAQDLEQARARYEALGESERQLGVELATVQERIRAREKIQQEAQDRERTAQQLELVREWLRDEMAPALQKLETRLLAEAREVFNREIRHLFAGLVEDTNMRAGVDAEFRPYVEVAGVPTPPEGLSGGERTALALAFRLALARMIRQSGHLHLETLILDEPTDGFSAEQVSRLADLLRDLGIPQVILVSHEHSLEGVADRVIRIRKVQGESQIDGLGSSPTPSVAQEGELTETPEN
jgi:exonuclease SbcC